jgi:hypothetical protein
MPDMENLTRLIAAASRMTTLGDRLDLTAVARSNERQALGIEIEERALQLVRETRKERGLDGEVVVPDDEHDDRPDDEPVVDLDGPFNPAKVRDAMLLYRDGFIIPELVAALDAPVKEVKKFVEIWAQGERLEKTGFKVGRHEQYRYVPPTATRTPTRQKMSPPEQEVSGAYADTLASGLPVRRAAMDKLAKEGRSRAGVAHYHRQRDKTYERIAAAQAKRKKKS